MQIYNIVLWTIMWYNTIFTIQRFGKWGKKYEKKKFEF